MKKLLLTSAVAALIAGPASATTMIIDDFTSDQVTQDLPGSPTPPSESELDGAGVLGGSRDIDAVNSSQNPEVGGTQVNTNGDAFNVSNASCCSGDGHLTYDGNDDAPLFTSVDTDGLGFVDLTNGGEINGRFIFDTITNDFPFAYSLTVWDNTTSQTANGNTVGLLGIGDPPVEETIPFSSFSGIDFTQIGAIRLTFSGPNQGDLTIDNFRYTTDSTEIPLPASLPMLLAGMGGLGFLGWRRAKKG